MYAQGNFIEADRRHAPTSSSGESKYGKPIPRPRDHHGTPQKEAAKCVLISFDSTMKSNISVGLPIDLLWYPRDSLRVGHAAPHPRGRIPTSPMLRSRWGEESRRVPGAS
jgi:putative proteasome-type protease